MPGPEFGGEQHTPPGFNPPGFDPPAGFDRAWFMPDPEPESPEPPEPDPVFDNNTQLRVVCWRVENTAALIPAKV